jgi:hypothetical protein
MIDLFDNTTKKHVDTEQYQTEYLEISRNRAYLSNIEPYDLDWKDTDIPQLSRNGSLSSSGRLSVGSDILSARSEDEEDLRRHKAEAPLILESQMPAKGALGKSVVASGTELNLQVDVEDEPAHEMADLRAQMVALKAKKQFSASTGHLGKAEGIGGGCQRLSKAPHHIDDELTDPVGSIPTKAPLSGSLMAKRFSTVHPHHSQTICRLTKSISVRSHGPLDQELSVKEDFTASSRLSVGPQRVMMPPQRVATSESNLKSSIANDRPPLRVQRATVTAPPATAVQSSMEAPSTENVVRVSSTRFEKDKTSEHVLQSSVTTPSLNEIKSLINDSLWSNR